MEDSPAAPAQESGLDLVGVAGYECSLDGAAYAGCVSPMAVTGLAEGRHTVLVRARDAAGNVDPTPASRTWVVDTTAPVVTVASLSVDATSTSGASVSFTASATDTDPSAPAVSCTRVSGSTFAIGATTVTCSATDTAGNTGAATFTVTVRSGVTQLTALRGIVSGVRSDTGTLKNLTSVLANAQTALDRTDLASACDKLTSFVSQVRAQSGKKIPVATADALVTDARRIMAVLGC